MSDVKISELPVATVVNATDVVPIVQTGTTKQAAASLFGSSAATVFSNPGGRLTTESGVPVSMSDRTSQGTLYYTPYQHNNIYTYSGSAWVAKTFSEISLSLSVTSGNNYDVFINSAATALSLSSAWTTDTSRADALGTQDGVVVLNSDHTKLWLGTIRASGSNVIADSGGGVTNQVGGTRFVWNAFNRVTRPIKVIDTGDNWSYTTNTIRQAHGASGNKIEYVTGDASVNIDATVHGLSLVQDTAVVSGVGVGIDSTTTFSGVVQTAYDSNAVGALYQTIGRFVGAPGLGYHYVSWNEKGTVNVCIFLGDNGGDSSQSGLIVTGEF